jgi:hypothetical protein
MIYHVNLAGLNCFSCQTNSKESARSISSLGLDGVLYLLGSRSPYRLMEELA